MNIKNQRGFTLIEIAFVTVFIAIISGGIIIYAAGTINSAKHSSLATSILNSSINLQKAYSTTVILNKYQGMTLTNSQNILTEDLRGIIQSNALQLGDGQTVALSASTATGSSGNTNFMWTFSALQSETCRIYMDKLGAASLRVLTGASGSTSIRNRTTSDLLTPIEVNNACNAQANAFRVVF